MDRGAWWAAVRGVTRESEIPKGLNKQQQQTCPLMRVSRDLVNIFFLTHTGRCLYKQRLPLNRLMSLTKV